MNGKAANNTRKPLVYVVDDERMVLKAVSQSVGSLDCFVMSFDNAAGCLAAQAEKRADLIISDINMPNIDGMTLLQQVKEKWPDTKILLITGFGDIPLAVEALKRGASDFIEKPLDENTFLPKVKGLLNAITAGKKHAVTEAERAVLKLIVEGKSNKEIAYLIGRSIRTVENHRHRLMKKLNIKSQAELVKFAISAGLTQVPE